MLIMGGQCINSVLNFKELIRIEPKSLKNKIIELKPKFRAGSLNSYNFLKFSYKI